MPRLGDFISNCPEIDVEVQSSALLADLKGGEVDVALRFGSGRYPGLFSERLMRDWLFPVCTPEFARRYRLAELPRLDGVPLLHSDNEPWSWWLAVAGVDVAEPEQGTVFNDSGLMLQAALVGQGLCLGRQTITYDDVAAGRLLQPFAIFVASPNAYYFVCRKEKLETAPVARFRQWLAGQVASYPALTQEV